MEPTMKNVLNGMMATVVLGTMALASIAPANAQSFGYSGRDRYVARYCESHPRDRDCRDWRNDRHGWDDRRYQSWYRQHYNNPGDAIAAGIFGLAVGAIANSAINSGNMSSSHVQRCEARYRSYDRRSDSYVGFDGDRHRCNL
jgi:hypothetical protein